MKPLFGTKIGDVPGITKGKELSGVRDMRNEDLGDICPKCGMMSIDGKCGCEEIVEETICTGCNMPSSQCKCATAETCPACGMMSMDIEKPCGCGMNEVYVDEAKHCEACGMDEAVCECGYMSENENTDESKAYGGKEPDYTNISKATAKKRLETIKDKYGKDWDDMLKAFKWASDPAAALSTLHKKAYGKWPSEK